MKKFLSIIFFTSFLLFYAQSATDKVVQEAAILIKENKFYEATSRLKNADSKDYRVQYFTLISSFKLLEQSDDNDFYSVNAIRNKAQNYTSQYGGRDANFTSQVKQILSALDKINPAKDIEEYLANEATKEKIRVEKEREKKVAKLNDDLLSRNYWVVKSSVSAYENDQSIEDYHLQYFQAMADFGLLKNNEDFIFVEVLNVNNEFLKYLSSYSDVNLNYTSKIRDAQKFMQVNYPASERELITKREELKKKKIDLKLQDDLDNLKESYNLKSYDIVLRKVAQFPNNTKYAEEVEYYGLISQYSILMDNPNRNFDQIANLRMNLNNYVKNSSYDNPTFRNPLLEKLRYMDSNFPKTLQDFNAKKEQEQQALAKKEEERQKEIKKEQRKIEAANKMKQNFLSLGYEGGTIAKYGLRFEVGGKSTIGFFLNARTSLINDEDLLSGAVTENKNEIVVGPNIKIAPWMFLNIGGGYGFYKYPLRNDYESISILETKKYFAGYGGVTFRLGNRINIIGGASFIDITEELYTPEYTFGLTFNLK